MRLGVSALLGLVLSLLLSVVLSVVLVSPARSAPPIEDYAPYQPGSTCRAHPMAGTVLLGRWIVHRYGGYVMTMRACGKKGRVTSEHQTGRALDWPADVRRAADRRKVRALLADLFAADRAGNEDARARRMGVMYVIWADHIYSSSTEFRPEPYLNAHCKRLRKCSRTLRHRDHVHISLDVDGARARTSWYELLRS